MASQQMIEGMITCFCDLYGKNVNKSLISSWLEALKRYDDEDIQRAGGKAMEECQRMPTPADVIGRIVRKEQPDPEEYKLINGKCSLCGHLGLCILEEPYPDTPRCRQCYTRLTLEQHKAKMKAIIEALNGKDATH